MDPDIYPSYKLKGLDPVIVQATKKIHNVEFLIDRRILEWSPLTINESVKYLQISNFSFVLYLVVFYPSGIGTA